MSRAGALGGLCDVFFDHSDKRIDRILQQVIQTDSLAGSFDRQHRPLVLGQSDRRLERHGFIGGLRDGAEPFAEDAGGHLGLRLRFGLGLCFHVCFCSYLLSVTFDQDTLPVSPVLWIDRLKAGLLEHVFIEPTEVASLARMRAAFNRR